MADLTDTELDEMERVLRPVVDMHAEVFRPGAMTNRDRLMMATIRHMPALLAELRARRAADLSEAERVARHDRDWRALLIEIAKTVGADDDREAAENDEIDEFDPWHALRTHRDRPTPPRPIAADVVNARHAADMLATTAPPSDAHPAWDDTRHDLVGSLRRVLAWVEMTGGHRG